MKEKSVNWNWRHLVLALLLAGTAFLMAGILKPPPAPPAPTIPVAPTESPARTESENSGSSDGDDMNMWAIPVPVEPPPEPSRPEEWKTMRHEGYMYSFQIPGDWVIRIPEQMNRSRSRLVAPPAQDQVRVVCAPFGIYDRPLEADMPTMDCAFLLQDPGIRSFTQVSSSRPKAGRFESRRTVRRFLFKNQASPWMAVATYVIARPKCFALVLLCPEERLAETLPAYERMVRSFDHWSPEVH